ncbi:unannotated protein [freshwater metagenome]|uniref:Unannotated protein n=1 Tax=freshwater metagenome TaxID=449393 RepID=A0A6J7IY70_9ZZZZ
MSGSAVLGLLAALVVGAYLLYALLRGEEL